MSDIPAPPVPAELVPLHRLHEAFRQEHRPQVPPEWFIFEICNRVIMLPQDKLANEWHVPVCQAGTLDGQGFGWRECDFMLVYPWISETDRDIGTCLSGRFGAMVAEQLQGLGFESSRVLVTNAMRFALPVGMTSYNASHKSSCAPFVRADAYACRPKAIITMGSDALRCFYGKQAKLDSYRGSVHEWQGIPVIPTCSPFMFSSSLAGIDVFQSELSRAQHVAMKGYVPVAKWLSDYRVCRTVDEVEKLETDMVEAQAVHLAIDTEYGNDNGREENGYLLSFQVSWGAGKAAIILLRGEFGVVIHDAVALDRIRASIVKMMKFPGRRLHGQNLRVDVEMPSREGMNFDEMLETGCDTMLAHWLLCGAEGDESHGLDHLVRKYVPQFGAYWKPVEDFLDSKPVVMIPKTNRLGEPVMVQVQKIGEDGKPEFTKRNNPVMVDGPVQELTEHKRSRKELLRYGYKWVPHEILLLYALIDADATWQISVNHILPALDREPKIKALFENIEMPASLHLLDVERQGIRFDPERRDKLRSFYLPEYESLLAEFRIAINWPEFNPNSPKQKASFLFSTSQYRDKKDAPAGAKCLSLTPLYNTDKYPREWSTLVAEGEDHRNSPSTKAATIDLLYHNNPEFKELKQLKHLSVLAKFLSGYLSIAEINEHGVPEGGKQVCNNIWADGRMHYHIKQTTTTGRESTYSPNGQVNPKKQEEASFAAFVDRRWGGMTLDEYRRRTDDKKIELLGKDWITHEDRLIIDQFKSCYVPEPGYVLIEADFATAEICVLAYCSRDEDLIEVITMKRDLHSEVAARVFRLPEAQELDALVAGLRDTTLSPEGKKAAKAAYKKWVDKFKIEREALRTAAKTVIFGIMYGRGAYALAREISKTGALISPDECEKIVKGFAKDYPMAWAWLEANKNSAIANGYVENPFGFRRYFTGIQNLPDTQQAAARREAANAPIQGSVAYLLKVAGINLYRMRYRTEVGAQIQWKVLLRIHDAILFEVREEFMMQMDPIINLCMSTMNKIPGTPHSLGVDITVYKKRWGEKAYEQKALAVKAA